mgnify:CR=1 FL=1|jgi:V/A-type H+-transporting ATPase subunit E
MYMAQQIQDLVASIRKDGVEAAKKEAASILQSAEEQAQTIIAQAQEKASHIISEAEKDIAQGNQRAEKALAQAGRDLLLSLKAAIEEQFSRILVEKASKALSSKDVIGLVKKALDASEGDVNIEVEPKTFEALAGELQTALAAELKGGLVLKPHDDVESGFRLVAKDGSYFYDYKASELAGLLQPYLARPLHERIF